MQQPKNPLQWMQSFDMPPPGEFDETDLRWEAGETQFGGKGKITTRVTVIPADRASDFVAGCLLYRHACLGCSQPEDLSDIMLHICLAHTLICLRILHANAQ